MKGNTQGLPAAGPDWVMQRLVGWVVVVGVKVVDAVGLVVVGTSGGTLMLSSTRHLERLPVLQSPHLWTVLVIYVSRRGYSYLLVFNCDTSRVNLCSTPRCWGVGVGALVVLYTLVGEGEHTLCTT